ncbi:MAG: secreted metal-binding protein [Gemmatimonadetes bacterium]|nr:secreted metal-binding protein [Gemmatimonadota bacterium]
MHRLPGPRPSPSFLRPYAALLLATLFVGACGGGGGGGTTGGVTNPPTPSAPSTPVTTTAVTMRSLSFDPPDIIVSPGAVVRFTNLDNIDHNVTFAETSIGGSGNFSSGTSSLTMPTATGTYAYRCTLHGGMTGTVKVQ